MRASVFRCKRRLYDTRTDIITLAPVYDCGSSLYPQADETIMESVLAKPEEQNYRVYEIPTSAIMINGKKLNYFDFISSLQCRFYLTMLTERKRLILDFALAKLSKQGRLV